MNKAEKLLFSSVRNNDIDGFNRALKGNVRDILGQETYALINKTDNDGRNVLMVAIGQNRLQMVDYILDNASQKRDQSSKTIDLRATDKKGRGIWHYAALNGHLGLLTRVNKLQLDINQADFNGDTPLHLAINAKVSVQSLDLLLQVPTLDINKVNNEGKTALHIAVMEGTAANVQRLLEKGADPNIQDNDGNTPLQALIRHHNSQRVVESPYILNVISLLKKAGADDMLINRYGDTAADHQYYLQALTKLDLKPGRLEKLSAPLTAIKASKAMAEKPSRIDSADVTSSLRIAFINDGLDPDTEEQWRTIGNSVVEHIIGAADQPRVLVTTFNFAARQYSSVSRNMLTGQSSPTAAAQAIDQLPNTNYIEQAYQKLIEAGKTPPPLWPNGQPSGTIKKNLNKSI